MTQPVYDTSAPVLVTGATGYVAGWIVKELLDLGFTVHAAVRDPSNADKLRYLHEAAAQSPGSIRYFKSDLLQSGSYEEAMQGCSVVFHTASPFTLNVNDAQKDLVEPAQLGTRNVLEGANRTPSVRRVVVTSSCAAIYGDNADLDAAPGPKFTEEVWNTSSSLQHQAYSYSKTLAEKEAWKIAEAQDRWDLVVINPSFVLGPSINGAATSESFSLMTQIGDGTMKAGIPNFGIGVVDVRDVAQAHLAAAFVPSAKGRHIVSAHNASFPEIASILRQRFGKAFPFPQKTLPKWLVWLVGPLADKTVTRKIVSRNVDRPFLADHSKSVRELGMAYRPMADTVTEMFEQMIERGFVQARS